MIAWKERGTETERKLFEALLEDGRLEPDWTEGSWRAADFRFYGILPALEVKDRSTYAFGGLVNSLYWRKTKLDNLIRKPYPTYLLALMRDGYYGCWLHEADLQDREAKWVETQKEYVYDIESVYFTRVTVKEIVDILIDQDSYYN